MAHPWIVCSTALSVRYIQNGSCLYCGCDKDKDEGLLILMGAFSAKRLWYNSVGDVFRDGIEMTLRAKALGSI